MTEHYARIGLIILAVLMVVTAATVCGLIIWGFEKERRGYDRIAKVMRRQRDDARKSGQPWTAARAWPRKDFPE